MSLDASLGYVFARGRTLSGPQVLQLSLRIRDHLRPAAMTLFLRTQARHMATTVDRMHLRRNGLAVTDGATPYQITMARVDEQHRLPNHERDIDYQTNPTWTIYPLRNRTLLMFFGLGEMARAFSSLPGIEPYAWEVFSQTPEGISPSEWRQRGRDWRRCLIDAPSSSGLGAALYGVREPSRFSPEFDHVLDAQPSLEQRVSWQARSVLINQQAMRLARDDGHAPNRIPSRALSDYAIQAERWLGSEEAQPEIERVAARIRPKLVGRIQWEHIHTSLADLRKRRVTVSPPRRPR